MGGSNIAAIGDKCCIEGFGIIAVPLRWFFESQVYVLSQGPEIKRIVTGIFYCVVSFESQLLSFEIKNMLLDGFSIRAIRFPRW